jgi:hypothetical protein
MPFPASELLTACEDLEGVLADCALFAAVRSTPAHPVLVTPGISSVRRRVACAHLFPLTQSSFVVQPVLQWFRRIKRTLAGLPPGSVGAETVGTSFAVLGLEAHLAIAALSLGALVARESLRLARLAHNTAPMNEARAGATEGSR